MSIAQKALYNKNWKIKKEKMMAGDPFEFLTEDQMEELGLGKDSLTYDELRHNNFQREYAKEIVIKQEMQTTELNTVQENIHDRYKKKAADF